MRKTTQTPDNTVLITGAAGFIGYHLAMHYRNAGRRVIGVDKCTDYSGSRWDIPLRRDMLLRQGVAVEQLDLAHPSDVEDVFARHRPSLVFHLAALAGARCMDMEQFDADNVTASVNVLAAADKYPPAHFLFSSSSSVYGENSPRPFSEDTVLTTPETPYASSKFTGEIAARAWASAFPVTIMRFFNVYGPWGRLDMAPFIFANCLAQDKEVPIISGHVERAWLYIDDLILACSRLAEIPPARTRTVNVAGPHTVKTMDVLAIIAQLMGRKPRINYQEPVTEVSSNPADLALLESLTGDKPRTTFDEGIRKFLGWHAQEWLPLQNERMVQYG